jgi:hypothetical protein
VIATQTLGGDNGVVEPMNPGWSAAMINGDAAAEA